MLWLLLTTALAQPAPAPLPDGTPVPPPPDRQRLGSYHSDPLFLPHLHVAVLGGVDELGGPTGFVSVETRLGGTFAFGVGADPDVLAHGPTLIWNWRLFSYLHYSNLDIVLRTPVPGIEAFQIGLGADVSPVKSGRASVRVRGLLGAAGISGELGLVVRAL